MQKACCHKRKAFHRSRGVPYNKRLAFFSIKPIDIINLYPYTKHNRHVFVCFFELYTQSKIVYCFGERCCNYYQLDSNNASYCEPILLKWLSNRARRSGTILLNPRSLVQAQFSKTICAFVVDEADCSSPGLITSRASSWHCCIERSIRPWKFSSCDRKTCCVCSKLAAQRRAHSCTSAFVFSLLSKHEAIHKYDSYTTQLHEQLSTHSSQ